MEKDSFILGTIGEAKYDPSDGDIRIPVHRLVDGDMQHGTLIFTTRSALDVMEMLGESLHQAITDRQVWWSKAKLQHDKVSVAPPGVHCQSCDGHSCPDVG
jgi:hypothetical protein